MSQGLLKEEELLKKIGEVGNEVDVPVYVVGGYLRDKILHKPTKDIDILVMGNGIEFARSISKKLKLSPPVEFIKFGTAFIFFNGLKIEFVSARVEQYEPSSPKPSVVQWGNLDDDLSRRDFTINTLACRLNPGFSTELVDLFDAQADIENKCIRTTLDPQKTFFDDSLRMMRAIRFAAQLGFNIEPKTFHSIKKMKDRISIVSQERITEELMKILACERPSVGFNLLRETGLLKIVLPEIDQMAGVENYGGYLHKDVLFHTLKVVDNLARITDNMKLRFTGLVHDIAKPLTKKFIHEVGWTFYGHEELGARMVKQLVHRLRLPASYANYARRLVKLHLRPIALVDEGVTDSAVRRLIVNADVYMVDLFLLCRADITSNNPRRAKEHLRNFNKVAERIGEVLVKDKLQAFQSPVSGHEIMETCGLQPGPIVGKFKKMIEDAILNGEISNTHEAAYEYLLSIKDKLLPSS